MTVLTFSADDRRLPLPNRYDARRWARGWALTHKRVTLRHVEQALMPLLSVEAALELLVERHEAQEAERVQALRDIPKHLHPRAYTPVLSPARLEREISRFQSRSGVRQVLWSFALSDSRRCGECATLHIRHASGRQERIVLSSEDDLYQKVYFQSTGRPDELDEPEADFFRRYVQPRLLPQDVSRAIKVSYQPYRTSTTSAVRDHPFKAGVREAYLLTTEYAVSHEVSGEFAAAHFARFSCVQRTVRVQWNGRRMLLLGSGLADISYGRLPTWVGSEVRGLIERLTDEALEGLREGEQRDLEALVAEADEQTRVSLKLLALRRPELLSVPGVMHAVRFLDRASYRRFLRHRQGAKALLRSWCGDLLGKTRGMVRSVGDVRTLAILHRAGVRSPEVKHAVLCAGTADHDYDVRDYVHLCGEARAAQMLVCGVQQRGVSRTLSLAADAGRMWRDVLCHMPEFRPASLRVEALHDELSRLQRRLGQPNVPLSSAQEKKYAHLDRVIGGSRTGALTFRRAQMSHDLIELGEDLHICVGSYQRQARESKCVIVGAYDEAGQARFCLEVQERKLIQFKGPHNSLPAGADLAAALRYVEESRLKVSGRDLSGNVEEAGEQAQAAGEGRVQGELPF
ncbi:hypothetical protein DVJ83_15875 (plasmid) [Deinococcus wulumuqiensis]|uniref:PcfJ-like protein n=1 Tax=Deinococcus wulumuqiensis TaxID=980427 RepID=A0A345ILR2_9DEIO|nr:PcfJ domain-containing protein [Deinococcus wulumuqiensis]AXH00635.1 hypothetical protein DVJ83_15875 [Deinococcus wulumuqiensis]